MISGVSSSYSSYTSTSTTSSASSKKFQEQLLAKLDTDGDGSISKDEMSTAVSSSDSKDGIMVSLSKAFSDLDSNDDDSLDADELAAMAPPPPPSMQPDTDVAESLLGSLDSDEDGAISSDELTAGLTSAGSSADSSQVFDALDTNEDGSVSLDELTAAVDASSDDSSNDAAAQALSKMVAALSERYDTEGNKPVGKYLNVAA